MSDAPRLSRGEVVLPCEELEPSLAFFTERLGFRLELIYPADAPRVAVLSGHGLRLRLAPPAEAGIGPAAGALRLACSDPAALAEGNTVLAAPNGTRIELVPETPELVLPRLRPELVVTRLPGGPAASANGAAWKVGRAGMRYRDLIPGRQGGRVIASHISIPEGGEVPDYVHYHRVRFQAIYCRRGWVRVVYEDQGPPFVLEAGDCVLQPPEIRHRVLACSPGAEVIELSSPAEHETWVEHELELPTPGYRPERELSGQRFVRHRAAAARWEPHRLAGLEQRDTGIGAATRGLAGVRVARVAPASPAAPAPETSARWMSHGGELLFFLVLSGGLTLAREGAEPEALAAGDSVVVPPGLRHALTALSADLELLEVTLPAELPANPG